MCVQDVRSESGMWCSTRGSMVLAVSWTPPFLVTTLLTKLVNKKK
jgi:hypothetical protein